LGNYYDFYQILFQSNKYSQYWIEYFIENISHIKDPFELYDYVINDLKLISSTYISDKIVLNYEHFKNRKNCNEVIELNVYPIYLLNVLY